MELVEGPTLAEWMAARASDAAAPPPGELELGLFAQMVGAPRV
jgi:hypothetical protein